MGVLTKALRCLNYAVQLDPTNDVAYYNRALLYYAKRNVPEIVKNLRLAVRHNPANKGHLRNSKTFNEVRRHPLFKKLLKGK